jgi:hypothetical protein
MPKLNHARCHGFLKDEHQGTNSHQLYPVLQGELNCFLTGVSIEVAQCIFRELMKLL